MPIPNFTFLANTSTGTFINNQSYIMANQPLTMTTPEIWMLLVIMGIGLLLASVLGKPGDLHQDLCGILATLFVFVAGATSWAVDTVTGYGVVVSGTTYVLMENHTIYHYDLCGVLLAIVFLICLANLYRLWLDYRRITKQETVERDRSQEKGHRDTLESQHKK